MNILGYIIISFCFTWFHCCLYFFCFLLSLYIAVSKVCAMVQRDVICVANAGDSRAVRGEYSGWRVRSVHPVGDFLADMDPKHEAQDIIKCNLERLL